MRATDSAFLLGILFGVSITLLVIWVGVYFQLRSKGSIVLESKLQDYPNGVMRGFRNTADE